MYKVYFLVLCGMVWRCWSKKYKIEGSWCVCMLEGKMVFIKMGVGDKLVKIDWGEVIDGLLEMEGKVDWRVLGWLYMDDEWMMGLVIEGGEIDIEIENGGIRMKGSGLKECLNDFVVEKKWVDEGG